MKVRKTLNGLICALGLFLSVAGLEAQTEPYRDARIVVEERIDDLLQRMTLAEKIGQMTLVANESIAPVDVRNYFIGGVLSGGGGYPIPNTPLAWREMVMEYKQAALATRLGIPLIYGVDAVHGHNNVRGAVIFPHNIGLGATRNPTLVEAVARITARETAATGICWDYAPVMDVPQDVRWGRTYEAYGEDAELVTRLATAYMRGLQGESLAAADTVLATPKHFAGGGAALWGTSPFGPEHIDRGAIVADDETFESVHLRPFVAAVENGALSVMASYASWRGIPLHAYEVLLTDVLKGELGFEGFVVSDWAGIDPVAPDYYDAVVTTINAGIDMNMVPDDYRRFINVMTRAVAAGDISLERIDDAVRRILRAKFALGLFDQPCGSEELLADVGSVEHRAIAREAVSQSLVLLKNDEDTLPIPKNIDTIMVAGPGADDIGLQSGGWTIEWQGAIGDITPGTTILEAIRATVSDDTRVFYEPFGAFEHLSAPRGGPLIADIGIVVVAEEPYAEWRGDDPSLALSWREEVLIERVGQRSEKLVVILISGRPLIMNKPLLLADAVVAAWLPGTEGQGVADVLFGDQPFTGKLPYTWPRTIEQLPIDGAGLPPEGCNAPLFPYGYGLTYEDSSSPWLDLAYECALLLAARP